jgi:hypothetical protein
LLARPEIAEFILKFAPFSRHIVDARVRRTCVRPSQQQFKVLAPAFGDDLDCAIGTVTRKTLYAKLTRLIRGRSAEEHALHSPAHDDAQAG